ncbi:MAG: DUF177 domain-containing protein [SAR324 cluster bacterium]|uniref:DUF177 domain-containing protein n=1 Tax=SAR324 cluster bacterium TaxID=2024889 RepID=A0A7X9IJ81_9DELT|nr:DUF177 domain-containing protein [SAR324 cluster bacterium]
MSLKSLNSRLDGGEKKAEGIKFLEAPKVQIVVRKTSHGALVKGKLKGVYKQTCSLCVEDVERNLDLDVDFMLKQRPEDVSEDDEAYQDDVGIYHFSGDQVDLEEILQEAILLSLTVYWHPSITEKGCCSHCKRKFVEDDAKRAGQSLGELLKKAGVGNN